MSDKTKDIIEKQSAIFYVHAGVNYFECVIKNYDIGDDTTRFTYLPVIFLNPFDAYFWLIENVNNDKIV